MEVNFAHATSTNLSAQPFAQQPFALGSLAPETHLWAPYGTSPQASLRFTACDVLFVLFCAVFYWEGVYYMFYCGGGVDRTQYLINLATSTDLWSWKRVGTVCQGIPCALVLCDALRCSVV
jgi:arabinan endo-1,5-alpha-L-arabinosidase